MGVDISVKGEHAALRFAAEELLDYVERLWPGDHNLAYELAVLEEAENGIVPHAEDDAILIDCGPAGGRLVGSNPRSVLFAVYRYLQELGVRWLRPGAGNDVLPEYEQPFPAVNLAETASYRYRTICIEGACSIDHARDLIDWAAKQAMNGYFLQFDYGTCFWRRWYCHEGNPQWGDEPEVFTVEDAQRVVDLLLPEIQRRGWRFERVGHGWTSRAIGLESESWDKRKDSPLSDDKQSWLAKVDGKRQFFHGVPLNTNLCYSSLAVREAMVEDVVAYAGEHAEVDLLHLWLADGTNNHCECESCAKANPADWYVKLLNEVDEALTGAGLPTRLVFLIYVDLLWPPTREELANPDRFVLMFAPITRSFQQTFAEANVPAGELPSYTRNKLEFPKDIGPNLQLLRGWQEVFSGDSFDFDYHLTWALYYDLAQMDLARVLHDDLQSLGEIQLAGYNSCQTQRVGFPHNLLMQVMAATLWDKSRPFAAIAKASFRDAYGMEAGAEVQAFFTSLSEWWRPFFEPVHRGQGAQDRCREGLANLEVVPEAIRSMRRLYERHHDHENAAIRHSWHYLHCFLELLELMLPAYERYLKRADDVEEAFDAIADWVRKHERELHHGLDVYRFVEVQRWRVNEALGRD